MNSAVTQADWVFGAAASVPSVQCHIFARTSVASAVIALALLSGAAIGLSPIASAKNTNVTATGGDGTAVDHDGTQGDFTDSVQGAVDDDGDQDAFLNGSEKAAPQISAAPK